MKRHKKNELYSEGVKFIFLFCFVCFVFSLTNLMKAQCGVHWGRPLKLGSEGSTGGGQLSAACFFWGPSWGWRVAGIPATCGGVITMVQVG